MKNKDYVLTVLLCSFLFWKQQCFTLKLQMALRCLLLLTWVRTGLEKMRVPEKQQLSCFKRNQLLIVFQCRWIFYFQFYAYWDNKWQLVCWRQGWLCKKGLTCVCLNEVARVVAFSSPVRPKATRTIAVNRKGCATAEILHSFHN